MQADPQISHAAGILGTRRIPDLGLDSPIHLFKPNPKVAHIRSVPFLGVRQTLTETPFTHQVNPVNLPGCLELPALAKMRSQEKSKTVHSRIPQTFS